MEDFTPRVNEANPDPRIACALLLDTSSSMSGRPIEELNRGFERFCAEIGQDDLARKRAEIMVITFGGTARVEIPFTEGRHLEPRQLSASGSTPLGAALNLALDELARQKQGYKQAGLEYYRPWLFVLTDGSPTDGPEYAEAAARVRQAEADKAVSVFGVGVGPGANVTRLEELSAQRVPVMLEGLSFGEFFGWLSASLASASASAAFGGSDLALERAETTEQIALPPAGWAKAY
jgi:uncharacterized protein YegL